MFDWQRFPTPLPSAYPQDALNIPEIMMPFFHIDEMTCLWWIRLRRLWRAGYFHDSDQVVAVLDA